MSDFAVRAEHVGKRYRIRHNDEPQRYVALRDVFAGSAARALATVYKAVKGAAPAGAATPSSREDFWALDDVSFEIAPGEVVGIIGRNGAGKSTLLKVLSRITEPTNGRVRLRGRVASLLEVGTGFHPELTGRENISLNGAILGMTRAEIRSRFDEIVAFAEVEQFLDTPVKRYSSGMYVRLAFAVAAHLQPEVLLVDEVLSVGDARFQMKCLGKMRDFSAGGRTVLYVSHNLASITSLCTRGILLHRGRLLHDTTPDRAVNVYLQSTAKHTYDEPHVLFVNPDPRATGHRVQRVEMLDEENRPKAILRPFDYVKLRVWFDVPSRVPQGSVVFELMSVHGTVVLKLETNPQRIRPLEAADGLHYVDCCISSLPLIEGQYILGVGLAIYGVRFLSWIPDAATVLVTEPTLGKASEMSVDRKGIVVVDHCWEHEQHVAC